MKWERRVWHFLILLILSLEARQITGRNPSGREGLRLKKLFFQKEQARFLRRLLFESSHQPKRNKGSKARHRWESSPPEDHVNDNKQDFDDFDDYSEFSHKSNGRNKEMKNVIDTFTAKSCCPQRTEIIQPHFGRNRTGHVVELYKDENTNQRFYELICDKLVENEPCRFLQGRNQKLSKCTQQYTYTYALVQSSSSSSSSSLGWSLDHIRMKSGCVCKLHQPTTTTTTRKKLKNSRWEVA